MSFVIAFCHQKGGVAKTTSALALGGCFAEMEHETLMIDLDPQANLTHGVGLDPAQMRHSAADVLLGNRTLLQVSRETGMPGLDIVPGNVDMLTAARFLYLRPGYEFLLRDSLRLPELSFYDLVLIDCPPSLGPLTLNALTAADLVIIPTQCEAFSMQALNGIFKLVNVVWSKTNPKLSFKLLVTMFDKRMRLHQRVHEQLQASFPHSMFNVEIGVDTKLKESQLDGQLLISYTRSSRALKQYQTLARELEPLIERHALQSAA